jgi:ammonia channel protein AmtB
VSVPSALIIGLLAGVLVVAAVLFFDKIRVDDPVGATAVHLANGVFGTIAVGLFSDPTVAPCAAVAKKGLFFGGGMAQLACARCLTIAGLVVGSPSSSAPHEAHLNGIRVTKDEEPRVWTSASTATGLPDFQGAACSAVRLSAALKARRAASPARPPSFPGVLTRRGRAFAPPPRLF